MARVTEPGHLDQRVRIESVTRADDGGGGGAESWSEVATVWAEVRPLSGREREQAHQLEADVDYAVTIRYRADVTAAMRVVWRGKEMQIRTIHDAGPRPLYLRVDCQEGPAT